MLIKPSNKRKATQSTIVTSTLPFSLAAWCLAASNDAESTTDGLELWSTPRQYLHVEMNTSYKCLWAAMNTHKSIRVYVRLLESGNIHPLALEEEHRCLGKRSQGFVRTTLNYICCVWNQGLFLFCI